MSEKSALVVSGKQAFRAAAVPRAVRSAEELRVHSSET